MSTYYTVTNKLKVETAESFLRSVQSNSSYYIFAAKHTPYSGGDLNVPNPLDNVKTELDIYNDMLFGKRIKQDDIYMMAKRYTWSSGTVYTMYDDSVDLRDEKFYVTVKVGTDYNIYKCLSNNNGAPSTQEPFGYDVTPTEYLQDGYVWKYMYSVTEYYMRRFGTAAFIPIIPNPVVTAAAIPGTIDVIKLETQGYGYDNYTSGAFPQYSDIAINNNVLQYGLDYSASSRGGFYKDCMLMVTEPQSPAYGEHKIITDYYINTDGKKVVVLDSPFLNTVRPGDTYEIYPNVFVYDISGTSTDTCYARAIISPAAGNSISRIEVIKPGVGYTNVITKIKTDSTVNVTIPAQVRAIAVPAGGHGSNLTNEINGHYVGISQSFTGDNTPLIASNDFRTIGILKDPRFANVNIRIDTTTIQGSFIKGEDIHRYKPVRVFGNVEIQQDSTVIGTNTKFTSWFRYNDRVIINNGSSNILSNISDIYSDTSMKIADVPSFTAANCAIYLIESTRFGTIKKINPTSFDLTNVEAIGFEASQLLLGTTSFSTVKVSNTVPYVTVSGRDAESFTSFNQLSTFVGQATSPNLFQEDELIQQDMDTTYEDSELIPSARFHSITTSVNGLEDRVYVTNVSNKFNLGSIRGTISDAYFTPQYKYDGELIKDSGEIFYIENLSPITRNTDQTETIKIILEF